MQDNKELKSRELENVTGGSDGDNDSANTIHPVFMWQCQECTKYLGKYYEGTVCDACGSSKLKYVRIM